MTEEWTLDELVARVAAALDAGGYPGAPNGRVRELPDRRAIRWYATRGLLDRPAAMRGRTAVYGPRHLLQLVAIKRRQAQGHSLAAIQAELVGASDATLRTIAALPVAGSGKGHPSTAPTRTTGPAGRGLEQGSGAAPVAASGPADRALEPGSAGPDPAALEPGSAGLDPAALEAESAGPDPALPPRAFWAQAPAPPADAPPASSATTPPDDGGAGVLTGVPLGPGVTLLLPTCPDPDDLVALRAAARPLLDLLTTRGLVPDPAYRRSAP